MIQVDWQKYVATDSWWLRVTELCSRKLQIIDAQNLPWSEIKEAIDVGSGLGQVPIYYINKGIPKCTAVEFEQEQWLVMNQVIQDYGVMDKIHVVPTSFFSYNPSGKFITTGRKYGIASLLGVYHYYGMPLLDEMLAKIFWCSDRYVILEGRICRRDEFIVEMHEDPEFQRYEPTLNWLTWKAASSGFKLIHQQTTDPHRLLTIWEKLPTVEVSSSKELDAVGPDKNVRCPVAMFSAETIWRRKYHQTIEQKKRTDEVVSRTRDKVLKQMREGFKPWMFRPIIYNTSLHALTDGEHRICYAYEAGIDMIDVVTKASWGLPGE